MKTLRTLLAFPFWFSAKFLWFGAQALYVFGLLFMVAVLTITGRK